MKPTMGSRQNKRRWGRLTLSIVLWSLATAPLCVQAQGFFGMLPEAFPPAPPHPIIDITDDVFVFDLCRDSAWVEATVTEAELLGKVSYPEHIGFGGRQQDKSYYHLQLRVDRPLLGDDQTPPTLDSPNFEMDYDGYRVDGKLRSPQSGDRVFALLERQTHGGWKCDFIGVPNDEERRRIDRVQQLLEITDDQQGALQALAGCHDADLDFAMWCIRVICPHDDFQESEQTAYRRFRLHISTETYRATLLDLLESPDVPSRIYDHATRLLHYEELPEAETQRFHQAHCQRVRSESLRSRNVASPLYDRSELGYLFASVYPSLPVSMRSEMLTVLAKLAADPASHYPTIAFASAATLYSAEDKALNGEILGIYRDHVPLNSQNPTVTDCYWVNLADFMVRDSRHENRLCDAGLEIVETTLPAASGADLKWLAWCVEEYANACNERMIDGDRLAARLQKLPAFTVTKEQREKILALLRDLNIQPLDTIGT